jgi:hypothetical protein
MLNKGNNDLICKDNISGIKAIYLFGFSPVFYSSVNVIEGVELISYPTQVLWKYELRGDFELSQSIDEDGLVNQSLSCELKKIDLATTNELNKITRRLVGVVVESNLGYYALMGLRNGCEIDFNTTTGGAKSEFSGFQLTITAIEEYNAPLFNDLSIVGIFADGFLLQENGDYILQENGFRIKL